MKTDITKVISFTYKSFFAGRDLKVYHATGEKIWTAPWYSYLFKDEAGNRWYLDQHDLERYIGCGYITDVQVAN